MACACAPRCPARWAVRIRGEVPIESVVDCVQRFADLGCDDIGIADTIGVGTPRAPRRCSRQRPVPIRWRRFRATFTTPTVRLAPTCSPAWNWASAPSTRRSPASEAARTPKGATGNVATEDVLYMLHGMGIETGIDLDLVCEAGSSSLQVLGRAPHA